ncbi:MAG TPA: hypothetical protein VLA78_09165, partial [Paracoccaceae bacterium]|nr:hypothetical protein [Paracoccaceae bacterium]
MEKIQLLLKGFWPHIVFFLVNILIVAAHILLPRYLDRPDLRLVAAFAMSDESETKVSNTISFVTSEVIEFLEQGDAFYSDQKCFRALRDNSLVPNSCRALALSTVDTILEYARSSQAR